MRAKVIIMGAAEHVETVLRTAVADAYRNAAAKVREKAASLGVGTPAGPVCDASDLIRLAVEIDALATTHAKTVEEWWAEAQVGVADTERASNLARSNLRELVDREVAAADGSLNGNTRERVIVELVKILVEEITRRIP